MITMRMTMVTTTLKTVQKNKNRKKRQRSTACFFSFTSAVLVLVVLSSLTAASTVVKKSDGSGNGIVLDDATKVVDHDDEANNNKRNKYHHNQRHVNVRTPTTTSSRYDTPQRRQQQTAWRQRRSQRRRRLRRLMTKHRSHNNNDNDKARGTGPTTEDGGGDQDTIGLDVGEMSIYHGERAEHEEFPWFVHASTGCGAALIWRDIIVTAGHCRKHFMPGATVHIGAQTKEATDGYDFYSGNRIYRYNSDSEPMKTRALQVHPESDLMVVSLSGYSYKKRAKLNFRTNRPRDDYNTRMASTPPSQQQQQQTKQYMRVVGFGRTHYDSYPTNLQKATIRYIPIQKCVSILGSENIRPEWDICGTQRWRATCFGDSGGPLMMGNASRILVGVVSWGSEQCLSKYHPGVYAKLSRETSRWVRSVRCQLSKNPPPNCKQRFLQQIQDYRKNLNDRLQRQRQLSHSLESGTNNNTSTTSKFRRIRQRSYRSNPRANERANTCTDTDHTFDLGNESKKNHQVLLQDRDCTWLSSLPAKPMYQNATSATTTATSATTMDLQTSSRSRSSSSSRSKSITATATTTTKDSWTRQDLCQYPHIAYRCPRTCNVCDLMSFLAETY